MIPFRSSTLTGVHVTFILVDVTSTNVTFSGGPLGSADKGVLSENHALFLTFLRKIHSVSAT